MLVHLFEVDGKDGALHLLLPPQPPCRLKNYFYDKNQIYFHDDARDSCSQILNGCVDDDTTSNRFYSSQQICFHVELFLKSSGNKKESGYILLSVPKEEKGEKRKKQTDPAAGFLWFQCRRSAAKINEADFGFYRYQIITDAWENRCWEMFADYSDRV